MSIPWVGHLRESKGCRFECYLEIPVKRTGRCSRKMREDDFRFSIRLIQEINCNAWIRVSDTR